MSTIDEIKLQELIRNNSFNPPCSALEVARRNDEIKELEKKIQREKIQEKSEKIHHKKIIENCSKEQLSILEKQVIETKASSKQTKLFTLAGIIIAIIGLIVSIVAIFL